MFLPPLALPLQRSVRSCKAIESGILLQSLRYVPSYTVEVSAIGSISARFPACDAMRT
jgi:hypothetical protein